MVTSCLLLDAATAESSRQLGIQWTSQTSQRLEKVAQLKLMWVYSIAGTSTMRSQQQVDADTLLSTVTSFNARSFLVPSLHTLHLPKRPSLLVRFL